MKGQQLTFHVDDINHIIVRADNEVYHFAEAILGMRYIRGIEGVLSDDERKLLLTKIISQEKIETDS